MMEIRPQSGVVVAPAGYGKTHRVSEIISSGLRVLVLTHTHVAVNNARRRQGVPHGVKLETIDAFARRLCLCFPTLSGVPAETTDWGVFEEGATAVLRSPAVATALAASYDQVVVDEFQDCSKKQVALVHALAALLPTLALGDPLQSLFDLLEPTQAIPWEAKTSAWVDQVELTYPWRWHDQPDRGAWISRTRTALLEGIPVELEDPSTRVRRVSQQYGAYLSHFMRGPGSWAVVAGDAKNPNLPSTLAKSHQWNHLTVLEVGQPKELVDFTDAWESGGHALAVLRLIKQCASSTAKVSGFNSCHANAAANKPTRSSAPIAALANQLADQASPEAALAIIDIVVDHPDTYVYRPQLLSRAQRALRIAQTELIPLPVALARVDSQLRHMDNNPGNGPVVGSVLRMKGLEFDNIIIVQPERLDSPEEIYVALTRAKRTCTIVVKEGQTVPWLAPPWNSG